MKLKYIVKDGKVPLKNDTLIRPWELLSVNLCGSWTVKYEFEEAEGNSSAQTRIFKFWTLTMIDEGSSWPKIASIQYKDAEEITKMVNKY